MTATLSQPQRGKYAGAKARSDAIILPYHIHLLINCLDLFTNMINVNPSMDK